MERILDDNADNVRVVRKMFPPSPPPAKEPTSVVVREHYSLQTVIACKDDSTAFFLRLDGDSPPFYIGTFDRPPRKGECASGVLWRNPLKLIANDDLPVPGTDVYMSIGAPAARYFRKSCQHIRIHCPPLPPSAPPTPPPPFAPLGTSIVATVAVNHADTYTAELIRNGQLTNWTETMIEQVRTLLENCMSSAQADVSQSSTITMQVMLDVQTVSESTIDTALEAMPTKIQATRSPSRPINDVIADARPCHARRLEERQLESVPCNECASASSCAAIQPCDGCLDQLYSAAVNDFGYDEWDELEMLASLPRPS